MPNLTEFDFENHNNTTANGFEWEFGQSAGTGVQGNAVLLGSFRFDSVADGTTLMTIEDRLPGTGVGNANWITPTFNILDEQIFGTGASGSVQFSIDSSSAVPEPSSLALLNCLFGWSLVRRRRTY